ncbi:MAG TPA: protein kinase [Solirubrobacteraceae bacterium]|nr:protein kinase [Solirubrobacteraceae bacterium]
MPHAPDLSGSALEDRYELHAVIGEGAFGRVYRAVDRRLERTVAVKLIKPWWAEDPEWARSFEREARILARLSDPGIVQIFDVGQGQEGLYYVSELIDGESLADRLRRGPLAPAVAAEIAAQLCRALARAHAENVVHRDVKPANIMLTRDGRVKVADFGVARLAEGSSDGVGATIVGTPRYMSPEQARGHAPTPATDVYSAGIVLYEMLAGTPPFTERAAVELALRHLRDAPPALPRSTPPALAAVTRRALAKAPADRFRDGAEMAQAIEAAVPTASARPAPAPTPARLPPPRRASAPAAPAHPRIRSAPERTRRAGRLSPRHTHNPAGRRRSLAALAAAFLLMGAMLAAGLIAGSGDRVRVPRLIGLRAHAIQRKARSLAVRVTLRHRYSGRPRGTAIAQTPGPGRRIDQGGLLTVVLSSGLRPVKVPELAGRPLADAESRLAASHLGVRVHTIVAPGVPGGTVTAQSPAPGSRTPPHSVVRIDVAETPRWQTVATLSGGDHAVSVPFTVRGSHWRVVYTMSFQGTCTWIVFCSGPTATVTAAAGGTRSFGLSDGGRHSQPIAAGPGRYTLRIDPGSDSTRWTAWIQDWY